MRAVHIRGRCVDSFMREIARTIDVHSKENENENPYL